MLNQDDGVLCIKERKTKMRKPIINKGDKYGKLTAIKFDHRNKYGQQYWLFKCECGTEKVIRVSHIKTGNTKACGCLKINNMYNLKHGKCYTKTYEVWHSMKKRCLNKQDPAFKNYGGRGIKICKSWLGKNGFQNFYTDMGERPNELSLDRIKNNLGYYKSNCQWATSKQQANNRRSNKKICLI